MKKTLKINYKAFCDWYFDDGNNNIIIEMLIDNTIVTMNDLLDGVCFLPIDVIINKSDIEECHLNEEKDELEVLSEYIIKFE